VLANSVKTKCAKGHPFDAKNTAYERGGKKRSCRTCHRLRERGRRQRLKEEV